MTFSNLKSSVNTGNGILEAVDFKILLGSMPLDPLDISHALGVCSAHPTSVTVGHHWRPRRAPPLFCRSDTLAGCIQIICTIQFTLPTQFVVHNLCTDAASINRIINKLPNVSRS